MVKWYATVSAQTTLCIGTLVDDWVIEPLQGKHDPITMTTIHSYEALYGARAVFNGVLNNNRKVVRSMLPSDSGPRNSHSL